MESTGKNARKPHTTKQNRKVTNTGTRFSRFLPCYWRPSTKYLLNLTCSVSEWTMCNYLVKEKRHLQQVWKKLFGKNNSRSYVSETKMAAGNCRVEMNLVLKLVVAAFVVDVVFGGSDVFDAAVARPRRTLLGTRFSGWKKNEKVSEPRPELGIENFATNPRPYC